MEFKKIREKTIEQHIEHLEYKARFESSTTAIAVYELIKYYKALTLSEVSQQRELLKIIFEKHYKETGYVDLRIEEANAILDNF